MCLAGFKAFNLSFYFSLRNFNDNQTVSVTDSFGYKSIVSEIFQLQLSLKNEENLVLKRFPNFTFGTSF